MNSPRKTLLLLFVCISVFSFVKKENTLPELNIANINISKLLNKQRFECRPSSEYMFYVDTEVVKKLRGADNINAKVFILERATGKKALIASENLQVLKFKGTINLKRDILHNDCNNSKLTNGDLILGTTTKELFCFKTLMAYESIYNSYLNSKNQLLN